MRNAYLGLPLAVCLSAIAGQAASAEMPQIGGVVNYVESSGSVTVNGVPVADFSTGEGGSGGTTVHVTDWLTNGANEVVLSVDAVSERGRAKLELQEFNSEDMVLTLEQVGSGELTGSVEVEGLPDWSWTGATPQDGAAAGLEDAVADFHDAFARADIDRIIAVARPFLTDQAHYGMLDEAVFREELTPILEIGELKDLPELSIDSYLDGRVFHVTDADGHAPVNLEFENDEMSGAVRTGEWWSLIEGNWQVIH